MRTSKVPKGTAFLRGTSAATLHKMAKDAGDGEDAIRYLAMYQRKMGREIVDIAESLGLSAETARRWLTRAHGEGLAGIARRKGGQHPRVSRKDRIKVFTDVLTTSPRDHNFDIDAWDFRTAVAHLNNVAGTHYSYKSGHRLLRKLGLRLMSPRPQNPKGLGRKDRKKLEASKRATLKRLVEDGFTTVCNEDEAYVQINRRSRKALGAKHCRPHRVPSTESRGALTIFMALADDELTLMKAKKGNGEAFMKFCSMMLSKHDKVAMLTDNASYHKSDPVKAFLKEHRDRLRILYLAPYTPEMAVIETQVGPVKRAIAKRSPKGKTGVWRALRDAAGDGEIPVNKLFDWMIIRDGGGASGATGRRRRTPAAEYAEDVIIIRPRRGQRNDCPSKRKRRSKKMPQGERCRLEKSLFRGSGVPSRLIAKIPDGVLRDIPPGLVRK